jgi:uncharacterized membrane protein
MNEAHLHLVINHFPIIGLILGCLVLLTGILMKSSVVRRVGLSLFLIAGITSIPAFSTGEGAEEIAEEAVSMNMCNDKSCVCPPDMIKKMEEEREHYIHEHEEKAEGFMPFMWGIIVLSLIAMFLEWKNKSMAKIASLIVLVIGFIAAFFAREVGTTGGEISHPEIRKGFEISSSEHEDND